MNTKFDAGLTDPTKISVHQTAEPAQPVAWKELLREARDNCKASIAEDGISAMRREYRVELEARLTAALAAAEPSMLILDEVRRRMEVSA